MNKFQQSLFKNVISLSRFMNLCLYKKEYGFYQKNLIGKHFVTSPEISQLFGECIAIFFLMLLKEFKIRNFCELGPGNGTLMKDLILIFEKFINSRLFFSLYEKSEYLRNIQLEKLNKLNSDKCSIISLKNLKLKKEPYFFFCNEFFDALPINQYEKINNFWFEKKIVFDKKLMIINQRTDYKFSKKFRNGDILEISPLTDLYLRKIFKHIQEYGGGILIFDYGPFNKKRINTLQAIHKSKKCGILDFPFNSDITYHVDFKAIQKLSHKFKLYDYGPITQREFLFFHGINERILNLSSKLQSRHEIDTVRLQFERLTSPDGMGNLIKCLFISNLKINSDILKTHV